MASYEYKTVSAPKILNIKTQTEADQAIASFGNFINKEAVDGWEFHSMESISTSEAPGCFGGNKDHITIYNMLIFKRMKDSSQE